MSVSDIYEEEGVFLIKGVNKVFYSKGEAESYINHLFLENYNDNYPNIEEVYIKEQK